MTEQDLGKLQSVHGIAPAYLQRAAIIVILSFIFFLAMLIAFSLRQNIGYFLLATAFLIVQLATLFGWITQKRTEFKIFENGFTYRKHTWKWSEIESVSAKSGGAYEIKKSTGEKISLTETILHVESIINRIRAEISKEKTEIY